jgi:hypothetical protein
LVDSRVVFHGLATCPILIDQSVCVADVDEDKSFPGLQQTMEHGVMIEFLIPAPGRVMTPRPLVARLKKSARALVSIAQSGADACHEIFFAVALFPYVIVVFFAHA